MYAIRHWPYSIFNLPVGYAIMRVKFYNATFNPHLDHRKCDAVSTCTIVA